MVDVMKALDGHQLGLSNCIEWFGPCWRGQYSHNILCGLDDHICWRSNWDDCFLWEKFDGVGVSFCLRCGGVYSVAPVMFHGRTQVPSIDGMGAPGGS